MRDQIKKLSYRILAISTLLCITENTFAIQHSRTVIQTGHTSPYVIENDSPSKNGNLTHAVILFYKPANGISCTCGRYDSIELPSKTMITWHGKIPFNKRTKLVQIVRPNFPADAGCMLVALYGDEKPTASKAYLGWFWKSNKEWPCFNNGIKKTIRVFYYPTPN